MKIELHEDPKVATQKLRITIEKPLVSATLPRLAGPLLEAVFSSGRPIVLDLRGVSEIDSEGLSLLLKLHKTMPIDIQPLSLEVIAGSQPERVLTLGRFGMIMTLLTE